MASPDGRRRHTEAAQRLERRPGARGDGKPWQARHDLGRALGFDGNLRASEANGKPSPRESRPSLLRDGRIAMVNEPPLSLCKDQLGWAARLRIVMRMAMCLLFSRERPCLQNGRWTQNATSTMSTSGSSSMNHTLTWQSKLRANI